MMPVVMVMSVGESLCRDNRTEQAEDDCGKENCALHDRATPEMKLATSLAEESLRRDQYGGEYPVWFGVIVLRRWVEADWWVEYHFLRDVHDADAWLAFAQV